MKILLYGINYSPELTGIGKYSGEMARWLATQGHEVRVITAPPYYPDWKVWKDFATFRYSSSTEEGVSVIRCPLYVPAEPSALKRLLHLGSFSLSSALALFGQLLWKPDLVVLVAPTLFCSPQALLLAKLTGAQSVLHIQDFEVDALFGLGIAKGGALKRFAFAAERVILRAFDRVSTISTGMLKRASQKGVEPSRLLFFPNWSELDRFRAVRRSQALLQRLGVDPAKRVLLYSGNIGEKQGLEIVLDAAARLVNRQELTFLIVGEGAGKARLVEQARQMKLPNVVFAPLQPYEDLPALLASANCHLVIQKRGAADAVLPSKLTNILAVGGNSVITADSDTSLGLLCEEYPDIAVRVAPESVDALLGGIEQCLAMPLPNRVATFYAEECLDKGRILSRFIAEFEFGEAPQPIGAPGLVTSAFSGEIESDAAAVRQLQDLIRAIAEQGNVVALEVAMDAALSAEANEPLADDIQALTSCLQQTSLRLEQVSSDSNGLTMQTRQLFRTELNEIVMLIGRVVGHLQAIPLSRPQSAVAGSVGAVISFSDYAHRASTLAEQCKHLTELTESTTT